MRGASRALRCACPAHQRRAKQSRADTCTEGRPCTRRDPYLDHSVGVIENLQAREQEGVCCNEKTSEPYPLGKMAPAATTVSMSS